MNRYSLVINGVFIENRYYSQKPVDILHKSVKWLSCPVTTPPTYDPEIEVVEGPFYIVEGSQVTETWSKRNLSSEEKNVIKQSAVDNLSSSFTYNILYKVITILENDIRENRVKINDVIDDTGSTVSKFSPAKYTDVTVSQVKDYIRNKL